MLETNVTGFPEGVVVGVIVAVSPIVTLAVVGETLRAVTLSIASAAIVSGVCTVLKKVERSHLPSLSSITTPPALALTFVPPPFVNS